MSFQEKLRLRLPAYLIFSFLGLLGLLSLWLPKFSNQVQDAQALTYSATSTVFRVPSDSKNKMIAVGDTFYLAFTSSSVSAVTSNTCGPAGNCNLYLTTSTNGLTWSSPVLVVSGLVNDDGNNQGAPLGDFVYNARQGYLATVYTKYSDAQTYVATSSNGVFWREKAVILSNGLGFDRPSGQVSIAFATATDMAAVTIRNGSRFVLTT